MNLPARKYAPLVLGQSNSGFAELSLEFLQFSLRSNLLDIIYFLKNFSAHPDLNKSPSPRHSVRGTMLDGWGMAGRGKCPGAVGALAGPPPLSCEQEHCPSLVSRTRVLLLTLS